MPSAFGVTPRFALKANPSVSVLKCLRHAGIRHIDASSVYEVRRALLAGFEIDHISLSTQMLSDEYVDFFERGMRLNLCSLSQLVRFGERFRGCQHVGLRFNPGLGSGEVDATNVGGPASSFGIWYESVDKVREILNRFNLRVVRIHTHIGSGTDVKIWNKAANLSLRLCKSFPHVKTLNLGGGFKVARMSDEISTDIQKVGEHIKRSFELFQEETGGRELHLEIEPGNYLCTSAGALVCTIQDVTSTSRYDFLKLDSGMTEILRPMLYGSQHNIVLVRRKNVESTYQIVRDAFEDDNSFSSSSSSSSSNEYVVVGKCCESGDLLTCKKNTPARIRPRNLLNRARIGDLIIVEGCGSYCSSMCAKHYNSYPTAAEVMCFENGNTRLIRRRGVLQDVMSGEISLEDDAFYLNKISCDGRSSSRRKSIGLVFLLAAFVLVAAGRRTSS
eukprot:g4213.t1